jgi:arylsulfatase A-like enzyme
VRFTNAYAYPVCSPTRSCILTGRFGLRTGTGNVVSAAAGNALKASEFTLPDAFAANSGLGYQLKHIGKWHLGGANTAPCATGGWPAFSGTMLGEIPNYTNWTKVVTNGLPAGTSSSTVTTYATTDQVNDAAAWIQTQRLAGKPWFAWVAFNAPHTPFHLPTPTSLCPHYTTLSGTTQDINAHPLSYYNAAVEAMDTEIGRLLASVDLATTTVIFIGDNGTPNQVLQSPFPAGHGKDTLYEGGVRVPLIICGPQVVSGGRTSDVMTHVVDLYATILELAGISVANTVSSSISLDSQSLMPVLQNQSLVRDRIYVEEFDTSDATLGGVALRDEHYKLIKKKVGAAEFYDLQADPYETTNLIFTGTSALTAEQLSYYNRLRYNFGRYTSATTPTVSAFGTSGPGFSVTVAQASGTTQTLWSCTDLTTGFWAPVSGATSQVSGANLTFTDNSPIPSRVFYSVLTETP